MSKFTEAQSQATQIRNETQRKANTAVRVGDAMLKTLEAVGEQADEILLRQRKLTGSKTIKYWQDDEPLNPTNFAIWYNDGISSETAPTLKRWVSAAGGYWQEYGDPISEYVVYNYQGSRYLFTGTFMLMISELYAKASFVETFISAFLTEDTGEPILDDNGNLISTL